jgi:hypothetical protein
MVFSTDGASPEEIIDTMRQLGFEPSLGMHDFVYKWKHNVELKQVLELISKMHAALKGTKIGYEVTTVV